MANLTVEQVQYVKEFFASHAEALRVNAEDDSELRDMFLRDADACERVEITDADSVHRALGITDDRDSMIEMMEEDSDMGAEIIALIYE